MHIQKTIIKILNQTLYPFNINIQKAYNKSLEFPIESSKRDIEIINTVLMPNGNRNERYTMVGEKRLYAAISAVKYIEKNNIKGDIVECGVWKGGCSLAMALTLKDLKSSRKIRLYDTFKGMTKPKNIDIKIRTKEKAFDIYNKSKNKDFVDWCYAPLDSVRKLFDDFGVLDNALFIKGDVMDTLNNKVNIPNEISILRLDTDWYESTLKELEVLYPKLSIGGVLLLDDYGFWQGARKAVDEYFMKDLNSYPLMWVNDHFGRGLVK